MKAIVREYQKEDVPAMRAIWNEVVAEGAAFPQTEELTPRQAEEFFVSQSSCGVAEDPVCGSGHCHIVPYWTERLGKDIIVAYQASRRGGTLYCCLEAGRVKMAGKASLYSIADVQVKV